MKILNNPAIVIRHLDYSEADRIVTFFTRDHGLLRGFARGVRKSRKRFGPALEGFSETNIFWTTPTTGDLVTLKEAEPENLHLGLRENLANLSLAAYGCELVEALLGEGHPQPEVFDLLKAFLGYLNKNAASWEIRLLYELRLLSLAGYSPHFLHCSKCGKTFFEEAVFFAADLGGSLCSSCLSGRKPLKVNLFTLGSLARSLRTPLALFEGFRFSSQTIHEGNAILKQVLSLHLLKPLKSSTLLEQNMPLPSA